MRPRSIPITPGHVSGNLCLLARCPASYRVDRMPVARIALRAAGNGKGAAHGSSDRAAVAAALSLRTFSAALVSASASRLIVLLIPSRSRSHCPTSLKPCVPASLSSADSGLTTRSRAIPRGKTRATVSSLAVRLSLEAVAALELALVEEDALPAAATAASFWRKLARSWSTERPSV